MADQKANNLYMQCTLMDSISCVGVGLHTGEKATITLKPSRENTGINFVRKDVVPGTGFIPARWYNVTGTDFGTTISNEFGVSLKTIEHLMAALSGYGIDNALVEVDGPEIKIFPPKW